MHAAVCDFILDCIQNSIEAEANDIKVLFSESTDISVEIRDNGTGMTESEMERAVDPFYTDGRKHRERKVGLGLPFLIQALEQVGGSFNLDSEKGRGTAISFSFNAAHVDTPPVGDISGMILQAFMFDGSYELSVRRMLEVDSLNRTYEVKRSEIIEILGDLNDADSLILAKQYLASQEKDLREGDR